MKVKGVGLFHNFRFFLFAKRMWGVWEFCIFGDRIPGYETTKSSTGLSKRTALGGQGM